MTDFSEFLPLFVRTEEDIRADIDARVNAGLSPDDPDWVDTRPGQMFYIVTQATVMEGAKLWSALTEYAAAANMGTSWGDYLDVWAESFGMERLAAVAAKGSVVFTGTNGTLIAQGAQVGVVQTDPDIAPPAFVTTQSGTIAGGTLTLTVEAAEAGVSGNVGTGAITLPLTPMAGVATITNPAATGGGTDPESDLALRARLLLEFSGRGSGTVADYERWSLELASVGRVSVVPAHNGPGTVLVVVSDAEGDPVGGTVVADLQTYLDPYPGLGGGRAPIGHTVTVQTVVATTVNVAASLTFATGFTLANTSAEVAESIREYIDNLEPGDDVIYNHVRAACFVEGVLDVPTLTLNGGTATIAVAITPTAGVAVSGTVVLS